MAGITLTGRRYYQTPTAGTPQWYDWSSNVVGSATLVTWTQNGPNANNIVCYKFTADYTNARSLVALAIQKYIGITMSASSGAWGVIGAYLYTSDPTGGSPSSVPSGYVASTSLTVNPGYSLTSMMSFPNMSCPNITAGTIYLLLKCSSYYDGGGTFGLGLTDGDGRSVYTPTFKGYATSLNVTPSTVSTGSNVTVSIGNAWSTETVRFYYGNTQLASATISNGSGSVNVPKSWFTTAGVTTSQTMTVQARLDGTSLTKNFTVQAGSNMRPVIATPTLSNVKASSVPSEYNNTYIANLSKVKVQAAVTAGSNATISTVRVTWSGGTATMSYNSGTGKYEATVGPITGNTTFTVTATDARGMTQQASVNLTGVVQYMVPVITINEGNTYRCNSSGTRTDGGTYVRAQCSVAVTTSLSGNSLQSLRFYIQEEPSKSYTLSNNTQSDAKAGRASDYYETLIFEAKDKIQTVTRAIRLAPATRNLTMSRTATGTNIGVGILPQSTSKTKTGNKSTIDLPEGGGLFVGGYIWGGLTRFDSTASDGSQFGKNFKAVGSLLYDAKNTECYFSKSSDSGWSNYPVSGAFSGVRKVIWVSSSVYIIMIHEISPTAGRMWICTNGGAWKSLTPS